MKRWIGIAMFLVPLCVFAQSFWDGNATVQRGDAGFESGLFAVSNSFAPDSRIVVQNLDTGQSTTATVTKRIDGQSDVLLLLSPTAASAIGIAQGTMARIRVTLASPPPTTALRASQPQEQVASRDPDINPGAAYPTQPQNAAQQAQAAQTAPAAAQPETTTVAAEPQPSEESLPAAVAPRQAASSPAPVSAPEAPQPQEKPPEQVAQAPAETPVQTPAQQPTQVAAAPAETAAPASTAETDAARQKAADEAIIAAAEARKPQKQLFLPPREDEKFAYHAPAETPAQAAATTPAETQQAPTPPQITAVIGEPTAKPAQEQAPDVALADAVAPQESRPQEIVGAEATAPTVEPAGAVTALAEPVPVGEPQKPVQTEVTGPVAVPAAPAEAPRVALAVPEAPPEHPPEKAQPALTTTVQAPPKPAPQTAPVTTIPKPRGSASWYLQLAAYATEQIAQDLAKTLVQTYPILVLSPPPSGTHMFRVVIGPLNRAESGTLLTLFRYRGFPDAFLKQE